MKEKGFVLVETIVTAVFVLGLFTFLVANIIPLVGDYDREENYDSVETIYDIHTLRKMILKSEKAKLESLFTLPTIDGARYVIYENDEICTHLTHENYCKKLVSRNFLDIRKIIITDFEISDAFVAKSKYFDRTLREYINVMPRYNNVNIASYDYERRIIVSFNDGRVGNLEILFDGGD